jgi:hypothetical protein
MNKNPFKENAYEICYEMINAGIAGGISFFSAILASGDLTAKVISISAITSVLVFFFRIKDYFDSEKHEYITKCKSKKGLLRFI